MYNVTVGEKLIFTSDIEVLKKFGIPVANAGLETVVISVATDHLLVKDNNHEKMNDEELGGPLWVIYGRHVFTPKPKKVVILERKS